MNKKVREELNHIASILNGLNVRLMEIKDEEEEKFDNLPEGIQESEMGESFQEAIDELEEITDNLEEVIDSLESLSEN